MHFRNTHILDTVHGDTCAYRDLANLQSYCLIIKRKSTKQYFEVGGGSVVGLRSCRRPPLMITALRTYCTQKQVKLVVRPRRGRSTVSGTTLGRQPAAQFHYLEAKDVRRSEGWGSGTLMAPIGSAVAAALFTGV